jgi:hypothetical protein
MADIEEQPLRFSETVTRYTLVILVVGGAEIMPINEESAYALVYDENEWRYTYGAEWEYPIKDMPLGLPVTPNHAEDVPTGVAVIIFSKGYINKMLENA